jgi:hypothetical protein
MTARVTRVARMLVPALALVAGLLLMHGLAAPSGSTAHPATPQRAEMPDPHAGDRSAPPVPAGRGAPSDAPAPLPVSHSVALCLAVLVAIASLVVAHRFTTSTSVGEPTPRRLSAVRAAIRREPRGSPQALLCVQLC